VTGVDMKIKEGDKVRLKCISKDSPLRYPVKIGDIGEVWHVLSDSRAYPIGVKWNKHEPCMTHKSEELEVVKED